jgi:hypothetical protein
MLDSARRYWSSTRDLLIQGFGSRIGRRKLGDPVRVAENGVWVEQAGILVQCHILGTKGWSCSGSMQPSSLTCMSRPNNANTGHLKNRVVAQITPQLESLAYSDDELTNSSAWSSCET